MFTCLFCFFFFNDTATTEIYTLSLHDALPISSPPRTGASIPSGWNGGSTAPGATSTRRTRNPSSGDGSAGQHGARSEEHTSELQSLAYLVCRLLLEKKKKKYKE